MNNPDRQGRPETHRPAIALANTYSPKAARQILTEGYQPQGSDEIPEIVPELVSGICYPANTATPSILNEPPQAPYPSPDKS